MRGFSSFRKGVAEYFLYPFCSGHEAVILFFILSGFVLSIPAIALRAQTYPVFVIRRLFRIYMPYLAALILAILGDMVFHGHVTHSVWFNEAWSDQVKWRLVWQHLTFIGQYDTKPFDPPIWSLVFEMRISLVFPLLCAIALKLRPGWLLITAVFISGLSLVVIQLCHLQHFDTSFILTAHYAAFFMVGIYLARQKDVISRIVTHLSRRKRVAFAALSVLFYLYGSWVSMNIAHRFTGHDLWYQTEWITVLGAGGLIVCSLKSGEIPRLCRGGSSSLTFTGVHPRNSKGEPTKAHAKEKLDGPIGESKPLCMGVQIPRGIYPEVPPQGAV